MTSEAMIKIKQQLPLLCQHRTQEQVKGKAVDKVVAGRGAAEAKLNLIKEISNSSSSSRSSSTSNSSSSN
eukprot:9939627-Heterocapsa_arctica.AAC.1